MMSQAGTALFSKTLRKLEKYLRMDKNIESEADWLVSQ
jgi:hypothetical protein